MTQRGFCAFLGWTVLTSALSIPHVNAGCIPVPEGLVSWWSGNHNGSDFSGINPAVEEGEIGYDSGIVEDAFYFNGLNANLRVMSSPSLDVGSGPGLTWEAWINPSDVLVNRPLVEWTSSQYGSTIYLWLGLNGPGSLVANFSDIAGLTHTLSSPPGIILKDAYQHIVLTYDHASGVATLNQNGAVVTERYLGSFTTQSGMDLYIGSRPFRAGAGTRYRGQMDEIAIYNRALSLAEIQAIYRAGSSGKCGSPAPPLLVLEPASQIVSSGDQVLLSALALGTLPLIYQWRFNGMDLPGETNRFLGLSNASVGESGDYSLKVSNALGSITSSNAFLTITNPACAPMSSGLIAWWPGDGFANNIVSTNDLMLQAAGYGQGKAGLSFAFDGMTSFAWAAGANLDLGKGDNFTIECWINPRDIATPRPILEWAGGIHLWISPSPPSAGLIGCLYANLLETNGAPHLLVSDADLLKTNLFQHVALTFEKSSGHARLYCNGRVVGEQVFGPFTPATATDLYIGKRPGQPAPLYTGNIDELSIFDRALSEVEIQAIVTSGPAGKCKTPILPAVLIQPQDQNVIAGDDVIISSRGFGYPPPSYQWSRDGSVLPGETNQTLQLKNSIPQISGKYTVSIRNSAGTVTSRAASLTVVQPICAPISARLIGFWQGEGNPSDFTGSNPGTIEGGVSFIPGVVGQAFGLDGISGDIKVPAGATLNLLHGSGLTIELWIRPADLTIPRPLVEWNSGAIQTHFWISQQNPGTLFANLRGTNLSDHSIQSAPGILDTNSFQHTALTYDKMSGRARLYRNGELVAEQLMGSFDPSLEGDLYLGLRPAGNLAGSRYYGAMDEVSIYDRALTTVEVVAIYQSRGAGKCLAPQAPLIVNGPVNELGLAGEDIGLAVSATGYPSPTYQWLFNGNPIRDATNAILVLTNVQTTATGNYSAQIRNNLGISVTDDAQVMISLPTCTEPPPGLAAWWPAEGFRNDIVQTNHLTLNSIGFGSGQVGKAFEFDGSASYATAMPSPGLDVGRSNGFTIELWISPDDIQNIHPILEWNDGGGNLGVQFWLSLPAPTGAGPGSLFANISDANGASHTISSPGNLLKQGMFQHIALTYEKDSGIARLFLSGTAVAEQNVGSFRPQTASGIFLGRRPGLASYRGAMDEVSVYARALNPAEINSIYKSGGEGKCRSIPALAILTPLRDQTALVGTSLTLAADALGLPPIGFQWQFNGHDLPGATNSSLLFTNVAPSIAGKYTVIIRNGAGETASSEAVLAVQLPICAAVPPGLVGWWRAEGTTSNEITHISAASSGSVGFTLGKVAQAFDFNGGTANLGIAPNSALDVGQGSGMTVEFWMQPDASSASTPLIEWVGGVHLWTSVKSPGSLYANLVEANQTVHPFSTDGGVLNNEWQHIAITYDQGTGDAVIYRNGTSATRLNLGSFHPNTSGILNFGFRQGSPSYQGKMDEISIYNRALMESEVKGIYLAGVSGKCFSTSAPRVLLAPAPVQILGGHPAQFTVVADGALPLSYQWSRNGEILAGATNSTYALADPESADAGNYSVLLSNALGMAMSDPVSLSVTPPVCFPVPPGIVTWWPLDGFPNDAMFAADLIVNSSPSYVSGKVGRGLHFDGVSTDAMALGSALNVGAGPGFTIEGWINPESASDPEPLVEWNNRVGLAGVQLWLSQTTPGSLFANLVDANNQAHVVTSPAGLIQAGEFQHVAVSYDRLSGTAALYYNGAVVAHTVIGVFSLQTTFTMYLGRRISGPSIKGFTGVMDEIALYNRALDPREIQGIYDAGTRGKCFSSQAPSFLMLPQNAQRAYGDSITFTAAAVGSPPVGYQWVFNGAPIQDATNNFLTVTNLQSASAGSYSVIISNAVGTARSPDAALTVRASLCEPVPSDWVDWWPGEDGFQNLSGFGDFISHGNAGFVSGKVGNSFNFDGVTGYLTTSTNLNLDLSRAGNGLSIEAWIKPRDIANGQALVEWNGPGGAIGVQVWISIEASGFGSAGAFTANLVDTTGVSHSFGTGPGVITAGEYQHVALTYDKASGVAQLYRNGLSVAQGNLGSFVPQASSTLVLGKHLSGSFNLYDGAIDELTLYSRALESGEVQSIFRASENGKCHSPLAPIILAQPAESTILAGHAAQFSVSTSASPPPVFQWLINGTAIVDATNRVLLLTNVPATGSGAYSVTVSNSLGKLMSTAAQLRVMVPACTQVSPGLTAWWPGEGYSTDIVGSNRIVLVGGVNFAPAKVGLGFQFDGGAQYAAVLRTPSLDLGESDGFTIQCWLNPVDTSSPQPLFEWNDAAGAVGAQFWLSEEGGAGSLYANLIDLAGHSHVLQSTNGIVLAQQFQHVALTYDRGSGVAVIYCNGVVVAQQTLGSFIPQTGYNLYFGIRVSGGAVTRYAGIMDEIQLFNRALSSSEVRAFFESDSAGGCRDPIAPVILNQSGNRNVIAGDPVTLSVSGMSDAPLNYQWSFNGSPLPGATGASLNFAAFLASNSGTYTVDISNAVGRVTSAPMLIATGPPGCLIPAPGLVGLWEGEDSTVDSTEINNAHGEGSLAFGAGQIGQAFQFNGASSDLRVPASPTLNFGTGPGFTIEMWINPANTTRPAAIAEWNGGSPETHFWLSATSPGSLYANLVDIAGNPHVFSTGPGLVVQNAWQHIALTYDKTLGEGRFYHNGRLMASAFLDTLNARTASDLYFGRRVAPADAPFNGFMDEISVYNRALRIEEIQTIFNARGPGRCGDGVPPSITVQPGGQSVIAGHSARINAEAIGSFPLTYQWRLNGGIIPEATNHVLILNSPGTKDEGDYSVVVSNSIGVATSLSAKLTVKPPSCISAPAGLISWWRAEGNGGDSAGTNDAVIHGDVRFVSGKVGQAFQVGSNGWSLKVPASGDFKYGLTNGFTIEAWILPSDLSTAMPIMEWNTGNVPGLHFWISQPSPSGSGPGSFFANIIDTSGVSHVVTSVPVVLGTDSVQHVALTYDRLSGSARFYRNGAMLIEQQVGNFIPQTSYDVYLGSRPGSAYFHGLIDEISVYGRALTQAEISSIYDSDSLGKCLSAPALLSSPAVSSIAAGQSQTFFAVATGLHPLTYQWRFNGTEIPGATNASLTLPNAQSTDQGDYDIVISNDYGKVISPPANLTVAPSGPTIIKQPFSQPGFISSNVVLRVAAVGSEPLAYQWFLNGNPLIGAISADLSIPNLQSIEAGDYQVAVSNPFGNTMSSNALLTIFPSISAQPDWPALQYTEIPSSLSRPVAITQAGDNSRRLFVVEQGGTIRIFHDGVQLPAPFLDISDRVRIFLDGLGEQGLLSLAFPPGYIGKNYFYVYYNRSSDGAAVISRFFLTLNPDLADSNSEQIVLVAPQPHPIHNGGQLAFGPDGFLYVGKGDGGPEQDPDNNAQNPGILLGKILRIDVESGTSPYLVPSSNPFFKTPGYAPEIWALGLRNPWRFSFDRQTGDLFIGDVGQDQWEEIDFQRSGSHGGQNYGWRIMEGNHSFNSPTNIDLTTLTSPAIEYSHTIGHCVIGGYVNRSREAGRLFGLYYYGDFMDRGMWAAQQNSNAWTIMPMTRAPGNISTFGEDEGGNLYVATISSFGPNKIYRLEDSRIAATPSILPGSQIYFSAQNAQLLSTTPGSIIRYTTDGRDPVETDPPVLPGQTVPVPVSLTLKARAFRADLLPSGVAAANFGLQVSPPFFIPAKGPITNGTPITISLATFGATVRYTLDGTDPTSSSPIYTNALTVNGNSLLKAKGFKLGFADSLTSSNFYAWSQSSAPVFDPTPVPITNGTIISITNATPGAEIRYTLNGDDPNENSQKYSSPLSISGDTLIKAISIEAGFTNSPITAAFYPVSTSVSITVTTLAGSGLSGAENGQGIQATFNKPDGLVAGKNGTLYVADTGNGQIRGVTQMGAVSVIYERAAAPHKPSLTASGELLFTTGESRGLGLALLDESITRIIGSSPGNLDGPAPEARLKNPAGMASDLQGNIFIADRDNNTIRRVDLGGNVITWAGAGKAGFADGLGTNALFAGPTDLCIDLSGNLFVADGGNNAIRKLSPSGLVTTVAGGTNAGYLDGHFSVARFNSPGGIAVDLAGTIYIADTGNNSIRKINTNGIITTLAGGLNPGLIDGFGTDARFNHPEGLAVGALGELYVADTGNNAIREIVEGVPSNVSGKVYYYGGQKLGVPAKITVTTTQQTIAQTNGADGAYSIHYPSPGPLIIRPEALQESFPREGVTTADISLIRRHILGISPLDSPYKLLAADVDDSTVVNSLDIDLVRQFVLGSSEILPGGFWKFVAGNYVFPDRFSPWNFPETRTYQSPNGEISGQDFVGIKLGDVNASWRGGNASSNSTPPELHVTLQPNVQARPGETILAPVGISKIDQLLTVQFTLHWDSQALQFVQVSQFGLPGLGPENFASNPAGGFLAFSWDDPLGAGIQLSGDTQLFWITFKVLGQGGTASTVDFSSSPTPAEATTVAGILKFVSENGTVEIVTADLRFSIDFARIDSGPLVNAHIRTQTGRTYILEACDSLNNLVWRPVAQLTGSGADQTLSDPSPSTVQRFYRIRVQ